VGRVWDKETLLRLVEICLEKNILICSDEIHCDLILDTQKKHIPTAALSDEIAHNTVTLMSPAKTFNMPGLNCGFAIIPNKTLRKQFKDAAEGVMPHVNTLGYTACQAAFSDGTPWLESVITYLRENCKLLYQAINAIGGLSMEPVEATYLAWIDIRQLNLSNPTHFFEQVGIGLMDGADFGEPGFVRLNFACSRENLLLAIERIRKAVEQTR
jgi:cystathionine beta-lyase